MATTRCIVNVSYSQYALHDRIHDTDWGELFEQHDGLLVPGRSGVAVSTETQNGPVIVDISVVDQLPTGPFVAP